MFTVPSYQDSFSQTWQEERSRDTWLRLLGYGWRSQILSQDFECECDWFIWVGGNLVIYNHSTNQSINQIKQLQSRNKFKHNFTVSQMQLAHVPNVQQTTCQQNCKFKWLVVPSLTGIPLGLSVVERQSTSSPSHSETDGCYNGTNACNPLP